MYSEARRKKLYNRKIFSLASLTAVFALGCSLLGYIFLPFAASAYASLLCFEKKGKRIFSLLLPITFLIINILLNGFFSMEALAYPAVGLLIWFFFTKRRQKSEAAMWITLSLTIFIIISFVFLVFNLNGDVSFFAVKQYFQAVYQDIKDEFIRYLSGISAEHDGGFHYFLYTKAFAEDALHTLLLLIPAMIVVAAFLLTGLTLKLFLMFVHHYTEGAGDDFVISWSFVPTTFISYFYIVIAVFALFMPSGDNVLSVTLLNVYYAFLMIFAYVGIKFLHLLIRSKKSGAFATLVIAAVLLFIGFSSLTLFSYLGIYYSIYIQKHLSK